MQSLSALLSLMGSLRITISSPSTKTVAPIKAHSSSLHDVRCRVILQSLHTAPKSRERRTRSIAKQSVVLLIVKHGNFSVWKVMVKADSSVYRHVYMRDVALMYICWWQCTAPEWKVTEGGLGKAKEMNVDIMGHPWPLVICPLKLKGIRVYCCCLLLYMNTRLHQTKLGQKGIVIFYSMWEIYIARDLIT